MWNVKVRVSGTELSSGYDRVVSFGTAPTSKTGGGEESRMDVSRIGCEIVSFSELGVNTKGVVAVIDNAGCPFWPEAFSHKNKKRKDIHIRGSHV